MEQRSDKGYDISTGTLFKQIFLLEDEQKKAVERHDADTVCRISEIIIKAISEQCRTVRVPMSQIMHFNKINKAIEKFEQLNERKPSIEELEETTQIEASKINNAITSINRSISLESP